MRIVLLSYVQTKAYSDPQVWLRRINAYTGVLDALSQYHEVISIEQINYEGLIKQEDVTYHFLKHKKAGYLPALHKYVKSLKPDIAIIHGTHFPLQTMHLKYSLGSKVRILLQNHAEQPLQGPKRMLQRWADRAVHSYLFTSREIATAWFEKKIIKEQSKLKEVMEASSVFHRKEKPAFHKTSNAPLTFLWVGRLDENKDPLTVVKAFLEFAQIAPAVRLYMIFHTMDLLDDIKALLPKENSPVRLIGQLPHHELEDWFNQADYIISGSHYEGSGVAVCEAMSCGCIPVLTNIPSFRQMTGNGQCGILYEPGNGDALLAALQKIIAKNIQEERAKVIAQFENHLSFAAIAKQIDSVIRSL